MGANNNGIPRMQSLYIISNVNDGWTDGQTVRQMNTAGDMDPFATQIYQQVIQSSSQQ